MHPGAPAKAYGISRMYHELWQRIMTGKTVITGYGHTANRPGNYTCVVSRTKAHCDTAVLPV